jgi:hypothetical protein
MQNVLKRGEVLEQVNAACEVRAVCAERALPFALGPRPETPRWNMPEAPC